MSLMTSKSGACAQQESINIISNNLANINTHGYKKSLGQFTDLPYHKIRQPGADAAGGSKESSGLTMGTGVKLVSTVKDFTAGTPMKTSGDLDLSINGDGFFQIQQADGTIAYTRDGHFQKDDEGNVITSLGRPLEPAITIPAGSQNVTIGKDGTVSVNLSGVTTPSQIGTIQLATFVNKEGLEPIGNNLYIETSSSGTPTVSNPDDAASGAGAIDQGFLEASNVNAIEELVNLIQAQRGFEMNNKALKANDEMLEFITQRI